MSNPDPIPFRNALGRFATGVTIVTTTDKDGEPVGVTASSFNSVSLEPPLVLWSLAKSAHSLPAYQNSGGFNVHVLAAHQTDISNGFARPGENKFDGIEWTACPQGFPLLPECAALFRCKTNFQYEGGDHIIFVGEVVGYEDHDLPALVFHSGKYAEARTKPVRNDMSEPDVDLNRGQFTDNFLFYLISRAHFQSSYPVRKAIYALEMSEREYFCLSLLSMSGALPSDEIQHRLEHTGHAPDAAIIASLEKRGWVEQSDGKFHISPAGQKVFIRLLAQSKALEEQILKHFSEDELAQASAFLKKMIDVTGSDIPDLW
jgi:3-hydroxy-9,10-secoandrosta-1,3,5(10)-triene-9,17-dione monooxygenase reductase component